MNLFISVLISLLITLVSSGVIAAVIVAAIHAPAATFAFIMLWIGITVIVINSW